MADINVVDLEVQERINRVLKGIHQVNERETHVITKIMNELLNEPVQSLKVLRTDDAKQFPLMRIKKYGDVGYDLPAVLPYKEEWKCPIARHAYIEYMKNIDEDNGLLNIQTIESSVFRETLIVHPHNKVVVPTGISIELPKGYWASIEARSSTSADLILVPKGVIDEGYRGELFAVLVNIGDEPRYIRHGERYVQLIVHRRNSAIIEVEEVDKLSESERGNTGFGSTGRIS